MGLHFISRGQFHFLSPQLQSTLHGVINCKHEVFITNRGSDPFQLGMSITIVIIRSIEVLSHSISSYLEIFIVG